MPKSVYLAGGFRSGWQKTIRQQLPHFDYFDPSAHSLARPAEYTKWDLEAVRSSDLLFAYMEASNPGGYALALEIGFAHALGIPVVLVEEHPNESRRHRFSMVREVSDYVFESFDEAVQFLPRLA